MGTEHKEMEKRYALLQFLPIQALEYGFHSDEYNTVAVLCVGSLKAVEFFKANYEERHKQAEQEFKMLDTEENTEEWKLDKSIEIEEKHDVMFCTMSIGDRANLHTEMSFKEFVESNNQGDLILEIVEVEYEICPDCGGRGVITGE